ncbi:LysE family translocator [Actinacidiphila rubida]|uniref:Threonine/homoserine/homoserine lactone efflux protein n=1 Tax=Actinacidiphila rubida TaxID=310780 RepID=A0A1H8UWU5_9ACTN|nr:LysE family translocator [Actinacidiphila rubida]SEP07690.1 Threonine/homoserine/homoserine lactone efflux protein [Actinacidiphila rubida]
MPAAVAAFLAVLPAFLGACVLIAASPGPSTMLIIRQSLRSRRAGFLTVLGNETGVFVWGVVAACGLTALLAASQAAYDAMRIVGAVVLVGFGLQTLKAARAGRHADGDPVPGAPPLDGSDPDAVRPGAANSAAAPGSGPGDRDPRHEGLRAYRSGLLLNLANPKAAVFALSFLPQFVPAGEPSLPAMIALAAVWAVFEVGYYGLYVWFVARMRAVISRAGVRRRLEQISGGVLLLLGLRLAVEG